MSLVTVDDRDPSIIYSQSPIWQQVTTDPTDEFDATKSGAGSAGMTASFRFTGTQIFVYGAVGSWDVYGVPVSSYTVDGSNGATFVAPIIDPGFFKSRLLFYQSPELPPGEHELLITNKNGTSPCVYWLDFIAYSPAAVASLPSSPSSPLTSPSTPPDPPSPQSPSAIPSVDHTSIASIAEHEGQLSPASVTSSSSITSMSSRTNAGKASLEAQTALTAAAAGVAPEPQTAVLTSSSPPVDSASSTSTISVFSTQSAHTAGDNALPQHISTAAVVGVAAGGAAIVIALCLFLVFWRRRKRTRTSHSDVVETGISPYMPPGNSGSRVLVGHPDHKSEAIRPLTSPSSFFSPDAVLVRSSEASTSHGTQSLSVMSFFADSQPDRAPLTPYAGAVVFGDDEDEDDNAFNEHGVGSHAGTSATGTPNEDVPDARAIRAKFRVMREARPQEPDSHPVLRHHEDSGVRLPRSGQPQVVDVPPAYSTA